MAAEEATNYRLEAINKTLSEHEKRLNNLERFTLMVQGALAVIGFILGSGFGTAVVLFAFGVI